MEKYSTDAMDFAAENGYLEVVKYLYSKGAKCTTDAMNYAAGGGHPDTVMWLYFIGAKCTISIRLFRMAI